MRQLLTLLLAVSMVAGSQAIASAEIILDFSHDTNGFFDTGTTNGALARAAAQKAASDISAVLNATLDPIAPPINSSTNQYQISGMGMANTGLATTTFDVTYGYTNPTTGANEIFNPMTLSANEVRIFVGTRNLSGSTLGVGGPGGFQNGMTSTGGSASNQQDFDDAAALALAAMESQANSVFSRGGNSPTFGTAGGTSTTIEFGASLGNLWFDTDTDDMNGTDTATELADFWHFDAFSPVASGKNDFYSVALHEILHSIGIGSADEWTSNVAGTSWLGANAIALTGSGAGLINGAGDHIAENVMSTRLSDGTMQEVVMDPNITTGTRKELTVLDVAFLQDIGWVNASAIPEPASASLLGLVAMSVVARRRRRTCRLL